MVDQRTRTNALISYFFLGWMFLLARGNPAFAHPFVRRHAWRATRIHLAFLVGLIILVFVLARPLATTFGFLPFTLGSALTLLLYAATVAFIARGAMQAYRDEEAPIARVAGTPLFGRVHAIATEREAALVFLGFVPIAGFFVHARHSDEAVSDAVRIGTVFAILFALVGFWSSAYVVSMALALACSVTLAWAGMSAFFLRRLEVPTWVAHLPLPFEYSTYLRIAFAYVGSVFMVLIGRRDALSFQSVAVETVMAGEIRKRNYLSTHPDRGFPLPLECLVLPGIQLPFAILMLGRPTSVYRFYYGQSLLLAAAGAAAWFFGYDILLSLCALVLLLAVASVRAFPEFELPVFGLVADILARAWRACFARRSDIAPAERRVTYKLDEETPSPPPAA